MTEPNTGRGTTGASKQVRGVRQIQVWLSLHRPSSLTTRCHQKKYDRETSQTSRQQDAEPGCWLDALQTAVLWQHKFYLSSRVGGRRAQTRCKVWGEWRQTAEETLCVPRGSSRRQDKQGEDECGKNNQLWGGVDQILWRQNNIVVTIVRLKKKKSFITWANSFPGFFNHTISKNKPVWITLTPIWAHRKHFKK